MGRKSLPKTPSKGTPDSRKKSILSPPSSGKRGRPAKSATKDTPSAKRRKESDSNGISSSHAAATTAAVFPNDELLKLVALLKRKDRNRFFWEPVDTELFPIYYDVIKEPMDFMTIEEHINSSKYDDDIDSFKYDILLIFDNAILFNEPGTVVSDLAKKLRELCVKELSIIENKIKADRTSQSEKKGEVHPSPTAPKDGSSEASLIIKRTPSSVKKRRIVIHGVTEKSPKETHRAKRVKTPKAKEPTSVSAKDLDIFLDQLMREDTDMFFHALIDPQQMPVYYEVVKRPICLLDIKDNIDPKEAIYPTMQEFEEDLLRVFDNAMEFNTDESPVFKSAHVLKEKAASFCRERANLLISYKEEEAPLQKEQEDEQEGTGRSGKQEEQEEHESDDEGEKMHVEDSKQTPKQSHVKLRVSMSESKPKVLRARILIKLLDAAVKKDKFEVFGKPVVKEEFPMYYDVIDQPMDFGTMKEKIVSENYATFGDFKRDLILIFENALSFNQPGSDIHSYSKNVKDKVTRLLDKNKFPESEPIVYGSVKKSDRRHSTSGKEKKESGKSSGLLKVKVLLSKKFVPVSKIVEILEELRANDTQQLFQKPLGKESSQTQSEGMKERLDFSTIEGHISDGEYVTVSDFMRDIRLLYENAMLLHEGDPDVFKYVEERYAECQAILDTVTKDSLLKIRYTENDGTKKSLDIEKTPTRSMKERVPKSSAKKTKSARKSKKGGDEGGNAKRGKKGAGKGTQTADAPAPRISDEEVIMGHRQILDIARLEDRERLFWNPVDTRFAPNYFEIVKRPICLAEIREDDPVSIFREKMELVFDNAMLYNVPGSFVHQEAMRMKALLTWHMDNLFEKIGGRERIEKRKMKLFGAIDTLVSSEPGSLILGMQDTIGFALVKKLRDDIHRGVYDSVELGVFYRDVISCLQSCSSSENRALITRAIGVVVADMKEQGVSVADISSDMDKGSKISVQEFPATGDGEEGEAEEKVEEKPETSWLQADLESLRIRNLRDILVVVVNRIAEDVSASDFQTIPDPETAPEYATAILEPMCFEVMKEKSEKGLYRTIDEVRKDINLICANATVFYPPDTEIHEHATNLKAFSKSVLDAIENRIIFLVKPPFAEFDDQIMSAFDAEDGTKCTSVDSLRDVGVQVVSEAERKKAYDQNLAEMKKRVRERERKQEEEIRKLRVETVKGIQRETKRRERFSRIDGTQVDPLFWDDLNADQKIAFKTMSVKTLFPGLGDIVAGVSPFQYAQMSENMLESISPSEEKLKTGARLQRQMTLMYVRGIREKIEAVEGSARRRMLSKVIRAVDEPSVKLTSEMEKELVGLSKEYGIDISFLHHGKLDKNVGLIHRIREGQVNGRRVDGLRHAVSDVERNLQSVFMQRGSRSSIPEKPGYHSLPRGTPFPSPLYHQKLVSSVIGETVTMEVEKEPPARHPFAKDDRR